MRKLLYLLVCLVALAMPLAIKAQKTGATISPDDPFAFRLAVTSFTKVQLPNGLMTETVAAYLKESNEHFRNKSTDLVLQTDKTSPGGRHLTYQQTYENILVFNAQVKVNLDKQGTIINIIDNSYATANWGLYGLDKAAAKMSQNISVTSFMESHPQAGKISNNYLTIAVINNEPAVYRVLETYNDEQISSMRYLLDENNQVVYTHDMNRYDATIHATAKPFVPDPLTRAGVYYDIATPYRDAGDSDIVQLNAQRVSSTINVTYDSIAQLYYLKNDRIEIVDFAAPMIAPATSSTPVFEFTRNQS